MTRPLRIEFPGAVYHVTSRGNARQAIYTDDEDREAFLGLLGEIVGHCHWLCHAYCLMGNHYHLLIETPEGNLSQGMRQLNGRYTQHVNRCHRRVGHVFQGRYKAILVDRDNYLLELCRYVVLNPVRARMVDSPEDYPWSSFRATMGCQQKPTLLQTDWLLAQFGDRRKEATERYHQFVIQGIGKQKPWDTVKGQLFLGDEPFVDRMAAFLRGKQDLTEIPRAQRFADPGRSERSSRLRGSIPDGKIDRGKTLADCLWGGCWRCSAPPNGPGASGAFPDAALLQHLASVDVLGAPVSGLLRSSSGRSGGVSALSVGSGY